MECPSYWHYLFLLKTMQFFKCYFWECGCTSIWLIIPFFLIICLLVSVLILLGEFERRSSLMTEAFLRIFLEWRHFYHEQGKVNFSENFTLKNKYSKLNKFRQFYHTSTMTSRHNYFYLYFWLSKDLHTIHFYHK